MKHRALLTASFVLSATAAFGQGIVPVVQEGDVVPGVGSVTRIDNLTVNDAGDWIVEADTDHPNTDRDSVLLKNGVMIFREGDPVTAPAGATIDSFDTVNLNQNDKSCWNFFLDGTTGINDDSGVYFESTLLIQEGAASSAPQLSPGSIWQGFFEVKLNDLNQALILGTIDDPAIPTSVDQVFLVADLLPDGTLLAENVIYKEGDVLPGQTESVATFGTGPHRFAFNDSSSILYLVDLNGSSTTDGAIYLDSALLAQEGSASPIAGRNWSSLGTTRLDLNTGGDYVYTGSLDGDSLTNLVLIKNGAKFQQEGDSPSSIAPFSLTSFGSGPLLIGDNGNVLWYGEWDDPSPTTGAGLFLNDTPLVSEGVTVATDGHVIADLSSVQDGYALSDDGRHLLFEAERDDGLEAAYYFDLSGSVTPMSDCGGNLGTLTHTGGSSGIGDVLTLSMDAGQAPGVFAFLAYSLQPAPTWPPCGIPLPGIGEILISVTPPNPVLQVGGALTWTGTPLAFNQGIPADVGLISVKLYAQGLFADLSGVTSPPEPFRLTGGVEIQIGSG